jgi:hypothetical protein
MARSQICSRPTPPILESGSHRKALLLDLVIISKLHSASAINPDFRRDFVGFGTGDSDSRCLVAEDIHMEPSSVTLMTGLPHPPQKCRVTVFPEKVLLSLNWLGVPR